MPAIQPATQQAVHRANVTRRVRARAFMPAGGGSYTKDAPGGLGYVYVRTLGTSGSSLGIARDLLGLTSPTDDNAAIWIEPDADGTWVISARRYEG